MRSACRGQPIISNIPYASYSGADVAIGVGWRLRIVRAEQLERPRNDAAAVRRAGRIRAASARQAGARSLRGLAELLRRIQSDNAKSPNPREMSRAH